jgi:ATP-binding cassette subfamily F protein uup
VANAPRPKKRKLTYKETAELAALPERIATTEAVRDTLFAQMADPVVLRDGARVMGLQAELASREAEIEVLMARWEELETIAAEAGG